MGDRDLSQGLEALALGGGEFLPDGRGDQWMRQRGVGSQHRKRGGDVPLGGRQLGQALAHEVANRRGDRAAGRVVPELAGQRHEQPGGAPGEGRGTKHGGLAQAAGERGARARGDQKQHRDVADPPREVGEHLERRRVGEVRIVDDQGQPAAGGDLRRQPEDAVCHRDAGFGVVGCVPDQELRRRPGRALEQRRAPRSVRGANRRLEQCSQHAEGEVALRRRRRRATDDAPSASGRSRRMIDQRGLAEPGGRLEHDHRALAGGQAADCLVEHGQLVAALDQRGVGFYWERWGRGEQPELRRVGGWVGGWVGGCRITRPPMRPGRGGRG